MEELPGAPRGGDRSWRLRQLLDRLAEDGRLSVTEASALLGVSEATVRRDFTTLASQQLVTRTHGGVVAASVAYNLPVRYRGGGDDSTKERIAAVAADLVTPGQVVGFNGGTTTSATARRLAGRADLGSSQVRPALTVVTNALNIATEMVLRPHIRTVSLGGVARPQSYELVGPLAHTVLHELWLDHLMLGVDGFTAQSGASCFHEGEASINTLMVEQATEVTVVAAAEKLGRRSFARICDVDAVRRLVTDTDADPATVDALRAKGLEVILA
ncbi:MAG TPA: DeoR/GlpR family DNA-binding transcription regulator [Nocardioidaceae bacterium]|nr:DeoR/GlpR family DNA-binding transcription regulator [Nocardioidaceae bacterium]